MSKIDLCYYALQIALIVALILTIRVWWQYDHTQRRTRNAPQERQ